MLIKYAPENKNIPKKNYICVVQISTYIKDLLYRYECVILPGFGAFLTQYRSATIDQESQLFYPPGKTVSFNRQLQTNDGLLANYVASVEGSSYEVALSKIRNFTGKLSLQLSENKKVTLDAVGEFILNEEQKVQFIPSQDANFSTQSFGLAWVYIPQLSREKVAIEEDLAPTPLLFTPEKRRTIPYFKYAAIGIIALGLAGFGVLKLYENDVQNHNYAEKQKADSLVDKQIQEATFVIANPLPTLNLTLSKEIGNYHIVAGAFRVEANAQKKINQLVEKGFSAKNIGENRYGLHQVVYSSHQDRLEALQTLRTIKRTENKDAWLLVQKLK